MPLKQTEEEKYTLLGGAVWIVIIGAISFYGLKSLNPEEKTELATTSELQQEIVESPPPRPEPPNKPQPPQPPIPPEAPSPPTTIPKNPTPAQLRCLEYGGGMECFEPDYIGTIFESYFSPSTVPVKRGCKRRDLYQYDRATYCQ